MHILWMLIVGLVVGALAKLLMPGRDPGGIFITMLIGVAGALLAGFLGRSLGWYHEKKSDDEREALMGPEHDWSSHGADAFGLMCVAYEEPRGKPQVEEPEEDWIV